MDPIVTAKHQRMRQVLSRQRPDRLPMGDYAWIEYRPEVYHLGEMEVVPEAGQVAAATDGKRRFTRDGGVWNVGDRELYQTPEDVLGVDLNRFPPEPVDETMHAAMRQLFDQANQRAFPVPHHYGTLITRATIEFGWEPFLSAAALDPVGFGRVLDQLGECSLRVITGWASLPGTELISVHDDIAATRGVILRPAWYREYVFPWYRRYFDVCHQHGRQAIWICDGNYLEVLDDILETGVDGLYCESSSMDPGELLRRAGPDKLYVIKTCSRHIDHGTPEEIRAEVRRLAELHQDYPGMMIYRGGGSPPPGNAEAFNAAYRESLVYA